MKLLVACKRVIDGQVRVAKDKIEPVLPKYSINPFDSNALEEAVRLKERGIAKEILAVSMGPRAAQDSLRTALAIGADRALHIPSEVDLEPLAVARLLAAVAAKESPHMLLMGKQAVDDDSNQTGQMVAALLGWPQGTFASKVEMQDDTGPDQLNSSRRVQVTREVDRGSEVVSLSLPAVVTADLRLNTPRFVTLPKAMAAKRKVIESITIGELGVDVSPQYEVVDVNEPSKRKAGVRVFSVAELVYKLHHEAKVI